jgi:hypothetical protein
MAKIASMTPVCELVIYLLFRPVCQLRSSAALEKIDHYHNQGYDQDDVNQATHGVAAHQPKRPQNQQYDSDRPQH